MKRAQISCHFNRDGPTAVADGQKELHLRQHEALLDAPRGIELNVSVKERIASIWNERGDAIHARATGGPPAHPRTKIRRHGERISAREGT
jgi:hypothetical protein